MSARVLALVSVLGVAGATGAAAEVLAGEPLAGGPRAVIDAWLACRDAKPQTVECAARRAAAVGILAADLRTVGSAGTAAPLPLLMTVVSRSSEPELRVAALDGVGMIGPSPAETGVLAKAFNDPVPAVRAAALTALNASQDDAARALAGRAVHAERWKSLAAEKAPDVSKLRVAPYAGATALRFAVDLAGGRAFFVADDAPEKVVAFYNAKAKRKAMSLAEFAAAYKAPEEESSEEASGDDSGGGQPSPDDMAKAMAQAMEMMGQMNQAMNEGKSMQQAAAEMGGAAVKAEGAADEYADERVYGAPRVIVLEEGTAFGKTNPTRYVVVFRDLTYGKTGIALHGPPVI